jgi:hypothetical protein
MLKEKNIKRTSLPEDSLANHSVLQEKEKEQMTIDISGMKLLESLENVNLDGLLEKTLKALLTSTTAWCSDRCRLIWKKRVSKSNVLLFQLQASVLGTKENEFGLWATPNTMDILPPRSKEGVVRQMTTARKGRTKPPNLREQVDQKTMAMYGWMYPTPTASDSEGGIAKDVQLKDGHFFRENKKGVRWGVKLRDAMNMFPTPRASTAMGENLETVKERLKTKKSKGKLEEKIAMDMFPTPTARDWKDTGQNTNYKRMAEKSILSGVVMMKQKKVGGRLNPEFVEFLMGYPLGWTEIETKD